MTQTPSLLWRALLAFLLLPFVVAFLVPWLLAPRDARFAPAAIPLLAVGAALLLWCVMDFYVAGRGTLAPWAPPTRLVIVGLYRVSRNPMYVAVLTILSGWAIGFHSRALALYAACVAVAFHIRVTTYEEPCSPGRSAPTGSPIVRASRAGSVALVRRGPPPALTIGEADDRAAPSRAALAIVGCPSHLSACISRTTTVTSELVA